MFLSLGVPLASAASFVQGLLSLPTSSGSSAEDSMLAHGCFVLEAYLGLFKHCQ